MDSETDAGVGAPKRGHRQRASKRSKAEGENEVDEVATFKHTASKTAEMKKQGPPKKRGKVIQETVEDTDVSDTSDEEAENEVVPGTPPPSTLRKDPVEYSAQRAMSCLEKVCNFLEVKWHGASITPDNAVWSKIGANFMRKFHSDYRLTFTSYESFNTQIGRFLAAAIYACADLEPKFTPGGVFVWRHGWFDSQTPRCLHGVEMNTKPRTVELSPSSEAGKRAIAEQGGAIERNRFNRQVVVLRFDKNVVCFKDASHGGYPFAHVHGSCGMSFSDAEKSMSAMRHDVEWTKALYPNADARRVEECILLCVSCMCNYAHGGPVAGRQTCRMTPYKLSGADEITTEMQKSRRDMRAHKMYPNTMVFTCCNPQSPNPRASGAGANKLNEKTCGWRISSMDLRYSYVFANELFAKVFGRQPKTNITEFKWNDGFAFKTDVITPISPLQSEDPFA